jgi:hypothetical protein
MNEDDVFQIGLGSAANDPYSSNDPWLGNFFDDLFNYGSQGVSLAERISQLLKKNNQPVVDPYLAQRQSQNNTLIYVVAGIAVIGLLIWILRK